MNILRCVNKHTWTHWISLAVSRTDLWLWWRHGSVFLFHQISTCDRSKIIFEAGRQHDLMTTCNTILSLWALMQVMVCFILITVAYKNKLVFFFIDHHLCLNLTLVIIHHNSVWPAHSPASCWSGSNRNTVTWPHRAESRTPAPPRTWPWAAAAPGWPECPEQWSGWCWRSQGGPWTSAAYPALPCLPRKEYLHRNPTQR